MKKYFLISIASLFMLACSSNTQTESQEEQTRDSADQIQMSEDEKMVLELERLDDSTRKAAEARAKDSMSN